MTTYDYSNDIWATSTESLPTSDYGNGTTNDFLTKTGDYNATDSGEKNFHFAS